VLDDSEDGTACPPQSVESDGEGGAENVSASICILALDLQ